MNSASGIGQVYFRGELLDSAKYILVETSEPGMRGSSRGSLAFRTPGRPLLAQSGITLRLEDDREIQIEIMRESRGHPTTCDFTYYDSVLGEDGYAES